MRCVKKTFEKNLSFFLMKNLSINLVVSFFICFSSANSSYMNNEFLGFEIKEFMKELTFSVKMLKSLSSILKKNYLNYLMF